MWRFSQIRSRNGANSTSGDGLCMPVIILACYNSPLGVSLKHYFSALKYHIKFSLVTTDFKKVVFGNGLAKLNSEQTLAQMSALTWTEGNSEWKGSALFKHAWIEGLQWFCYPFQCSLRCLPGGLVRNKTSLYGAQIHFSTWLFPLCPSSKEACTAPVIFWRKIT